MPRCFIVIVALLWSGLSLRVHAAGEWPQFRGPDGQGHAEATGLPLHWSETENVAWKTPIPGEGHSSPIISGDDIWLTTAIVKPAPPGVVQAKLAQAPNPRGLEVAGRVSLRAVCIDRASGRIKRDIELFVVDDPEPIHSLNSYASPTPVIDQERVYCHFGTYGTACLDADTGETLWTNRSLKVDHQNGPGSSPILWRDLLIVHFDGIDRQFVAALSQQTGEVVWKRRRTGEMHPKAEFQKAYCTPLVIEDESGRVQLLSPAANWIYSYDPATGRELWRAHYGQLGFSTVPRPVVGHGLVFVCTSYIQSRLLAVRYDGRGDVTDTHVVWHSDSQIPKKPSLLLVGDELYFVSDNGVATCVEARTGKRHWRVRLGGQYSASPLYADGHIYFFSQEGKTTVIKPGTQYRQVAVNQLQSGFMASPAAAGRALFLRTETDLYRIERSNGRRQRVRAR